MATRTPIECPLCHDELTHEQPLEEHLVENHTKRELARFIVAETEMLETADVSE